jgi:ribosomal protein S18 acetylase RimI-like enzyme
MEVTYRPATPADADAAVPLIYSSGPVAFDFVFKVPGRATALEFLHRAFVDGDGEFGHRNHVVGVVDGCVVAAGAAWNGTSTPAFTLAAARQIIGFFGARSGSGVIVRGLRLESVIRPPARDCWYVAHLGVPSELRSRGIGATLIAHLLAQGRDQGMRVAALDVAVTNPAAQRLYERLGFAVTRLCVSKLSNGQSTVADLRRMELRLAPGPQRQVIDARKMLSMD